MTGTSALRGWRDWIAYGPGHRPALIKSAAFVVASLLVTLTIVATISPLGAGDRTEYQAIFSNASRIGSGDDVRVAGVSVGSVQRVRATSEGVAQVWFTVDSDVALDQATRAEIRFLDLAGNRYLALVDAPGQAPRQDPGTAIPVSRTQPALDLDDLLAGFKPLLVALSPEDVNRLTLDIIKTLQGDGTTIRTLIARTASLTQGLAEREGLLSQVLVNLHTTVGTLAGRSEQLDSIITDLSRFTKGLAQRPAALGQALAHVDSMTVLVARLLAQARPDLKADIGSLGRVAAVLNSPLGRGEIKHAMDHLPDKLERLTATAGYGSWFNYYLCGVRVTTGDGVDGLSAPLNQLLEQIHLIDTSARCQP